jgi:hypothetical protein
VCLGSAPSLSPPCIPIASKPLLVVPSFPAEIVAALTSSNLTCSVFHLFFSLSFSLLVLYLHLSIILLFSLYHLYSLASFSPIPAPIPAGCKLYFEKRTDSPAYDSPAFTAFVNSKNSMTIRVNKPPSEKYDYPLLIDTRWKIEKLREVIAEEINLPPGDLRMFKGAEEQSSAN